MRRNALQTIIVVLFTALAVVNAAAQAPIQSLNYSTGTFPLLIS